MGINGINPNAAIGAYLNSQNIAGGSGNTATVTQQATGGGFSSTLQNMAGNTTDSVSFADILGSKIEQSVDTLKSSEEMVGQAVTGKADLTEVVQAVTSAELSLQTVVAVRDKMISAYQEIMRMQI